MGLDEVRDKVERFNKAIRELFAFLLIPVFARFLLEGLVTATSIPTVLKWFGVAVFFVLLGFFIWSISTGERRTKVLGNLHSRGIFWPTAYSVSLLYFAIACFTALLFLISYSWGGVAPTKQSNLTTVEFSPLQDFFLVHFLGAIPALKVPETLLLEPKYEYTTSAIGFIVLLFKVAVLGPLIATFAVSFVSLRRKNDSGALGAVD